MSRRHKFVMKDEFVVNTTVKIYTCRLNVREEDLCVIIGKNTTFSGTGMSNRRIEIVVVVVVAVVVIINIVFHCCTRQS